MFSDSVYGWNETTDDDSDYYTSAHQRARDGAGSRSASEALGGSSGSSSELFEYSDPSLNLTASHTERGIPPPPFSTPPKLHSVEYVMKSQSGTDVASLRLLTTALARDAIFGREELTKKSLSGRKNT